MRTIHRLMVAIWALLVYLGQITVVIGLLSLKRAGRIAGWFGDDDGQKFLKVIVALVLAFLTWRHWDFVVFAIKYDWDHDRAELIRIAFFFVKGIAALAVMAAIALALTAVLFALLVVPIVTITEVFRAQIRGVIVAYHAIRATKVAQDSPDAPPDGLEPILIQVSDLHIAAPELQPFEIEVDPAGWPLTTRPTSERLVARLLRILDEASTKNACPIVITGDITDTGIEAEWNLVTNTLAAYADRVVLAPGNHDISINRTAEPDYTGAKRAGRQSRFLEASKRLNPASADSGFDELFPMRRPLARGATLFVLDSNRYPSRYVLSNAVGRHGDPQLDRLETDLRATTGPVVIATHHHPVRHSGEGFSVEDIYMIAIDGKRLLAILDAYQRRTPGNSVLVIHGHRHLSMYGRHKGMLIYGHPSSTLGQASNGTVDGSGRYASVHLSDKLEWFVVPHKVESEFADVMSTSDSERASADRRGGAAPDRVR